MNYRQGDVMIRRVRNAPQKNKVPRKDGILMHGEVTGHAHRIEDLQAAECYDIGDRCFLRVSEEGVSIVHEEHGTIILPPGNYEVRRQREYAPDGIRSVLD